MRLRTTTLMFGGPHVGNHLAAKLVLYRYSTSVNTQLRFFAELCSLLYCQPFGEGRALGTQDQIQEVESNGSLVTFDLIRRSTVASTIPICR